MMYLGIAIAGAIGAPARYLLDGWVQHRWRGAFPLGTLLVNLLGSFVLGLVGGWFLYRGLPSTPRVLIGAGFCGAFTTFSTFAFESVRLAETRRSGAAIINIAATIVGSCLAAAAGLAIAAVGS